MPALARADFDSDSDFLQAWLDTGRPLSDLPPGRYTVVRPLHLGHVEGLTVSALEDEPLRLRDGHVHQQWSPASAAQEGDGSVPRHDHPAGRPDEDGLRGGVDPLDDEHRDLHGGPSRET